MAIAENDENHPEDAVVTDGCRVGHVGTVDPPPTQRVPSECLDDDQNVPLRGYLLCRLMRTINKLHHTYIGRVCVPHIAQRPGFPQGNFSASAWAGNM